MRRGLRCAQGLRARKSPVQFQEGGSPGRGRGFLPHLAPRGSGGSGEPSGGLRGRGPGPPVWHMVGEGEGPASGASPEAVSEVVAVAPSSTEDSILNPSSGGTGGSGLWGVSSPQGLTTKGVERETGLLGGQAHSGGEHIPYCSSQVPPPICRAPSCPHLTPPLAHSAAASSLLAAPSRLQAQSYPRAFARVVPTAQNPCP